MKIETTAQRSLKVQEKAWEKEEDAVKELDVEEGKDLEEKRKAKKESKK